MDAIKNTLHMDHMTMQFGGVVAVNGLSLDVNEHEIVALTGLNSAGKTTTFDCVTSIYQPTYGSTFFNSQVILADTPQGKTRRLYTGNVGPTAPIPACKMLDQIIRLGITRISQNIHPFGSLAMFENVLIAKHMRVKQNVFSAALCPNHAGGKRMRDESLGSLEAQDLMHLKDEAAFSLPCGLQRRLEITRTLAVSPSLLLLGEPAVGVNPQETQDLTDFIKQIRDDYHLTTFMIEHHMNLVIQISGRIHVLGFGKLTVQGAPDEVQNNPKVVEAYLGVSDDVND